MPKGRSYKKKNTNRKMVMYKSAMNQADAQYKLKITSLLTTSAAGTLVFNTQASGVTFAGDFTQLAALYGVESSATIPIFRGRTASIIDMDGDSLATTLTEAIEYDSFKMHASRSLVMKRYVSIPPKYRQRLNDLSSGFANANKDSTIQFLYEDYSAETVVGYYVLKWYITCLGRR